MMVNSRMKSIAKVLLEIDINSVERLFEQHGLTSWREEKPSLSLGNLGQGGTLKTSLPRHSYSTPPKIIQMVIELEFSV